MPSGLRRSDFLVAFSWRTGLRSSCNAQRMAEAAHLIDHVFPPLPVRQWVLSVPKRLCWHQDQQPKAISAILHNFLRVVEANLRQACPATSTGKRLGAVSFVHRFGAPLDCP